MTDEPIGEMPTGPEQEESKDCAPQLTLLKRPTLWLTGLAAVLIATLFLSGVPLELYDRLVLAGRWAMQTRIREQDSTIATLNQRLQDSNAALAQVRSDLATRDATIQNLNSTTQQQDARISELSARVQQLEAQVSQSQQVQQATTQGAGNRTQASTMTVPEQGQIPQGLNPFARDSSLERRMATQDIIDNRVQRFLNSLPSGSGVVGVESRTEISISVTVSRQWETLPYRERVYRAQQLYDLWRTAALDQFSYQYDNPNMDIYSATGDCLASRSFFGQEMNVEPD